jgi:hypothetical protein
VEAVGAPMSDGFPENAQQRLRPMSATARQGEPHLPRPAESLRSFDDMLTAGPSATRQATSVGSVSDSVLTAPGLFEG